MTNDQDEYQPEDAAEVGRFWNSIEKNRATKNNMPVPLGTKEADCLHALDFDMQSNYLVSGSSKSRSSDQNHELPVDSQANLLPVDHAITASMLRLRESNKEFRSSLFCILCNKNFNHISDFTAHQRTHSDCAPFLCMACGERFSNHFALRRHERFHLGENRFACKLCNKSFSFASNLRRHELLHTGKRPFVCKLCCRSFTRSSHLQRHELLHTRSSVQAQ